MGLVAQCRPQQEPDVGELPASSKGREAARGGFDERASLLVGGALVAYLSLLILTLTDGQHVQISPTTTTTTTTTSPTCAVFEDRERDAWVYVHIHPSRSSRNIRLRLLLADRLRGTSRLGPLPLGLVSKRARE